MKSTEIRELTAEELDQQCRESRRELFNLRIQQTTGQIENPVRLRSVRRDVARIKTELSARNRRAAQ